MLMNMAAAPYSESTRHTAVVLFYKYFLSCESPVLRRHGSYYEQQLAEFQRSLCQQLELKGRVLISSEGVNGTLSAVSMHVLEEYIQKMEDFELIRDCGLPAQDHNHIGEEEKESIQSTCQSEYLFRGVDWKKSLSDATHLPEPFPDLKVSVVKEIISSGGTVSVDEIPEFGGKHLDPQDFHHVLAEEDNVVLIDVRNSFECDIGHFVNPKTKEAAINPNIIKFSMFDDAFCARQAETLKDKKVLMYCTGGIRCEKASVMLKRRGVQDVSQLKGGIHRYLEEFGNDGFFQGMNFVFDQRVAMSPAECQNKTLAEEAPSTHRVVVGKCVACQAPYDELAGGLLCTVCRDPVLVCQSCQKELREYHCRRHKDWRHFYFTFLEVFDRDQLLVQRNDLLTLRESLRNRNMRRTLMRQVEKINQQLENLDKGLVRVNPDAPRRCRACMEPRSLCHGNCWGFWKTAAQQEQQQEKESNNSQSFPAAPIQRVEVGDIVESGPNWNTSRLGPSTKNGETARRTGKVVEVKPWGSGGSEMDCVVVAWDEDSIPDHRRSDRLPQPYRWGTLALNGERMYDVSLISSGRKG